MASSEDERSSEMTYFTGRMPNVSIFGRHSLLYVCREHNTTPYFHLALLMLTCMELFLTSTQFCQDHFGQNSFIKRLQQVTSGGMVLFWDLSAFHVQTWQSSKADPTHMYHQICHYIELIFETINDWWCSSIRKKENAGLMSPALNMWSLHLTCYKHYNYLLYFT